MLLGVWDSLYLCKKDPFFFLGYCELSIVVHLDPQHSSLRIRSSWCRDLETILDKLQVRHCSRNSDENFHAAHYANLSEAGYQKWKSAPGERFESRVLGEMNTLQSPAKTLVLNCPK